MRGAFAGLVIVCLALATPVAAQGADPADCSYGICQYKVSPSQLLAQAETLVREGRHREAQPLIEALRQAPDMKLQTRFLVGYSASARGDFKHAASIFKSILTDDPN